MLTCEICGKECKTAQGLSGHRRLKHSVVSGGSSGGDQSDQGSVSGGDHSGEWSGDHSEAEKAAAAVVAVVGAGVVAGDPDSEWTESKILGFVREHQETGVWDPEFPELVKDVLEYQHGIGENSPRARAALRTFGRFESS